MKGKRLLFLLFILLFPFVSKAETKFLYDVLKNATEEGTYAKEYTGEHNDSIDESKSTRKIYHWNATNSTIGNEIQDKNNVIFGGFCWQIIRTTDTGGVKLIYNGVPNNGKCNNTGADRQIGESPFNELNGSVADVGYMYNTRYVYNRFSFRQEQIYTKSQLSTSSWYANSVNWNANTNKWDLVNPFQVTSTDDFSSLAGSYVAASTSASSVSYIAGVSGSDFYYFTIADDHELDYYNYSFTYGKNYTKNNDGTYSIVDGNTIDRKHFFQDGDVLPGNYVCKNAVNNKCEELWYLTFINELWIYYNSSNDTFKFAEGFTYNNGKYTLSGDTVELWDIGHTPEQDALKNHHYTCFDMTLECETISYVYSIYTYLGNSYYYVKLNDGKNITDAVNEMLYNNDVNKNDSTVKSYIDNWYKDNLINYSDYMEDTVFCASRKQTNQYNGFNPNGGYVINNTVSNYYMLFYKNNDLNLSCENDLDRYSIANNKAKLKYPIGLVSYPELNLLGDITMRTTGTYYWLMSPHDYGVYATSTFGVYETGSYSDNRPVSSSAGVRPVISLKSGVRYKDGDGSKNNPYTIDPDMYYKVEVENNDKTKEVVSNIVNLSIVYAEENVILKVYYAEGYVLNSIKIFDSDNNEVSFTMTNNKDEFTFDMPSSDVLVKLNYQKIESPPEEEDPNAMNSEESEDDNPNTSKDNIKFIWGLIILFLIVILAIEKIYRRKFIKI